MPKLPLFKSRFTFSFLLEKVFGNKVNGVEKIPVMISHFGNILGATSCFWSNAGFYSSVSGVLFNVTWNWKIDLLHPAPKHAFAVQSEF